MRANQLLSKFNSAIRGAKTSNTKSSFIRERFDSRLFTLAYSAALLCFLTFGAKAAAIAESVSVNTSSLAGTAGAIDLSFNPGLISGTQAANATVTGFAGAILDSANPPSNTGNASGMLPGVLRFDNRTQLNEVFTPVIFGSSFNFILSFSGPAVDNPDPASTYDSVFSLGLFSTDGNTPLITPDGIIATVDLLHGQAAVLPTTFSSIVSIQPVSTTTPEPSTAAYLVAALLTLGVAGAIRRRQACEAISLK
ncbi:MAG: NF038129 family PEP-CTERM protein [Acidobacteriaceae bacterium]|nr:NF038129 family PEP-CTERM protein [Acidobacteriaceae bacterium]